MQFTPNNKLASLGTIGLLFLAGIAGMVFLLPYNTAHAAGPTVTLSTLSSGVLTAAPSATVGTTLTIEGFGFAPATAITIITTVGSTTVPWLNTIGACTTTNSGSSGTSTPASLIVGGCLTTTAVGNFAINAKVPNLPGGAQTVTVSDGTSTGTATLTITPKVSVSYTGNNFGFPQEAITPAITVTGFGSAESVSVATAMWTTTTFSCTTGSSVSTVIGTGYGSCATGGGVSVVDTTGGAKTITATGATSGLTATTTYTVNPWAAFYNSQAGVTAFSFLGTAPTSLLIEAHGLTAGTIAANSITIGGSATNHASVVIGSSGAIGGAGVFLVVSPTTNVPFGPASVVIGGTTFSYAAGNIAVASGVWGGALISSIIGTTSSTGVATTDASSYKPGGYAASTTSTAPQTSQIGVFGYGFVPAHAITITAATGASESALIAPGNVDANGAFFSTQNLADTAWSTSGAPTTAASYGLVVTEATQAPANILSPSIGIIPWIGTITNAPSGTSTVDYQSTETVAVHGFGATDVVTTTIGGASMVSGGVSPVLTNGFGTTSSGQVPDIGGGKQNVVATGSITGTVVTSTGAVTYAPIVGLTAGGQALSINTGGAGQTTTLRTGSNYGVHGLIANDGYQIVWNAIGGSITVGTFTATATGGIPIPGVQFTIPSDSSGIHIIDIQNTGSYALYGSTFGGNTVPQETPFSSAYTTAYGDMLFKNVALLQSAPSVALIGSPESLSGSGLSAGGSYVVTLSSSASCITPASSPALAIFTATGTGGVPSGTSITLGDTPTVLETGTLQYLTVQTAAHYGTTCTPDAFAQFVLAANANLNMTSAPAGHSVVVTAHALNPTAVYAIVFNYLQSPFSSTAYTGTTVGEIAPNAVGAGSATFNVPSGAASGSSTIQLVVTSPGTGGAPSGTAVLDNPLNLTVGGTSGSCTNEGTACMGISGTPSVSKSGGNTIISATFTNNSNAPQTAFIYAVVHNALGQTVEYTTATVSPAAGGSQTGQLVLFGLAPGTYSVTVFVVSASGTALSTTTNVSVTI
jgi:hypothetical protein